MSKNPLPFDETYLRTLAKPQREKIVEFFQPRTVKPVFPSRLQDGDSVHARMLTALLASNLPVPATSLLEKLPTLRRSAKHLSRSVWPEWIVQTKHVVCGPCDEIYFRLALRDD